MKTRLLNFCYVFSAVPAFYQGKYSLVFFVLFAFDIHSKLRMMFFSLNILASRKKVQFSCASSIWYGFSDFGSVPLKMRISCKIDIKTKKNLLNTFRFFCQRQKEDANYEKSLSFVQWTKTHFRRLDRCLAYKKVIADNLGRCGTNKIANRNRGTLSKRIPYFNRFETNDQLTCQIKIHLVEWNKMKHGVVSNGNTIEEK